MLTKTKTQTYHATMLVTRVEEWCVEAASPDDAQALLEQAKATDARLERFVVWSLVRFF